MTTTFDDLLTTIPTPEMIDTRVRQLEAEAKRTREEKEALDRVLVGELCKQHRVVFVREMASELATVIGIAPTTLRQRTCSIKWPLNLEPQSNIEVRIRILRENVLAMFEEDVAPLFARRGWRVSAQEAHYGSGMCVFVARK